MKNITKKQMITLTVLIAVLVLVIAVQYFYRPVLEKKSELADKVENMTMVYEDMKMLAAYYSRDAGSYKDDMITNMLVASNISIESSEISELVKETVRVECAVDKEKEESVDGYSAIAMYPEGGKVVSDDGDHVSLQYETGECTREIYYNVSGRYEDIISFLSKVYNQKSMEISRFYFNSGDLDAVYESGSEEEVSESIPTIGEIVKTGKIVSNSIYKAGIGIKVHMYDRSFDLVSRTDY